MDKIIFTLYRILENFFRSTTKSNEIYTSLDGSEEELDEKISELMRDMKIVEGEIVTDSKELTKNKFSKTK